jgi:hypothetical protein
MHQQDKTFFYKSGVADSRHHIGLVDSKNRKKSHACVPLIQALLSFEWKQQKKGSSYLSNNGQILGL